MKYQTLLCYLCFPVLLFSAEKDEPTSEQLISNLAHDDVGWNAIRAYEALLQLDPLPVKELEHALDSEDYQQRQLAAYILRSREVAMPSQRLLEVTVEGLRDDSLPEELRRERITYMFVFNALDGTRFLNNYVPRVQHLLLKGLNSDDAQERFLCAYLLGIHGVQDSLNVTSEILISHLRDNDIMGDACMSSAALYRLGVGAKPYLDAALEDADEQQFQAIHLVLLNWESPPKNEHELRRRSELHSLSDNVHDPSLHYHRIFVDFPPRTRDER